MKVFEELLLDADWSINAGMWLWLSCSSFFQQFFHTYCPVSFGKKADPTGDYIRLDALPTPSHDDSHQRFFHFSLLQEILACPKGIPHQVHL
mgnify:CR=1 FL=1